MSEKVIAQSTNETTTRGEEPPSRHWIIRSLAVVGTVFTLMLGALALSAPAQATDGLTYEAMDATRACQQQYGGGVFGSSLYSWSPDGIYCYGASIPFGVSWIGTLDKHRIYSYCRATYGDQADAVVRDWWGPTPAQSWWCVHPS